MRTRLPPPGDDSLSEWFLVLFNSTPIGIDVVADLEKGLAITGLM